MFRSSDLVGDSLTLTCLIPVICFIKGLDSTSMCFAAGFFGFILKSVVLNCAFISRFLGLISNITSAVSSDLVDIRLRYGTLLNSFGLSN